MWEELEDCVFRSPYGGKQRPTARKSDDSLCPQLEDSPRDVGKNIPSIAARSTISNVSHLHENNSSSKSESLHSFDSVSCKSEIVYHRPAVQSLHVSSDLSATEAIAPPIRRTSCPSIMTTDPFVVNKDPVNIPQRRVLSLCTDIHYRELNESRANAEMRRERLKASLSKLSASIASASRSIASARENQPVATNVSKSIIPNSPPETPNSRNKSMSQRSGHRRDSGCVIFDEELLPAPSLTHESSSSVSDILSPGSPIAPVNVATGTLRILAPPVLPPLPPYNPPSGSIQSLHSVSSPRSGGSFVPSATGQELMQIFTPQTSQDLLWSTFLSRARGPIEYADTCGKMPSVVYCLRGLIRFGNGDTGASYPDVIPILFHIMTGRHPVCSTSAFVEAAECAACVLSMLAVSPVTRQGSFGDLTSRPKFEPTLTAQNAILFQQVYGVLSQQIVRWIQAESPRDTTLVQTNRGVSALLEVMFVYCSNPKLRAAWMIPAPEPFRRSVPPLILTTIQKLPQQLLKGVHVLDAILDHVPYDPGMCRTLAQGIHALLNGNPSAPAARSVIVKWSPGLQPHKRRTKSLSSFFKTFSRSTLPTPSNKITVYTEYSKLN